MDLSASEMYYLAADELRQQCVDRLSYSGLVRTLRQRLVRHIKSDSMQASSKEDAEQASASADLVQKVVGTASLRYSNGPHGCGEDGHGAVLVELLRQIPSVASEEPKAIMQLFVRLDEIHELGLVNYRTFVTRILPLVSGSLLTFIGGCLLECSSWAGKKAQLLEIYFPYFVRERLIRELIVLIFTGRASCCTSI